ncbi:MAG: DUF3572 domain-containing protein [Paracoccaceae bacterium]
MTYTQDAAEALALEALGWLAGNEDLLPVFMGATGVSAGELRAQAAAPEFLGAVLDFLLMDDAWVIAFCDAAGRAYTDVAAARAALPGGAQVNWT